MKKLLLSLGALSAVVAPVAAVVACGSSSNNSVKASSSAEYDATNKVLSINVDLGTDKSIETLAKGKILELMRVSIKNLGSDNFNPLVDEAKSIKATFNYKGQKILIARNETRIKDSTVTSVVTKLNANLDLALELLSNKNGFEFVSENQEINDQSSAASKFLGENKAIQNIEDLNRLFNTVLPGKGISVEKNGNHFVINFGFSSQTEDQSKDQKTISDVISYLKGINAFKNVSPNGADQSTIDKIAKTNSDIEDILELKPVVAPKATTPALGANVVEMDTHQIKATDTSSVVAADITDVASADEKLGTNIAGQVSSQGTISSVSYDSSTGKVTVVGQ